MGKVGIIGHAGGLHALLAEGLAMASTVELIRPLDDDAPPVTHKQPRNKKLGAGAQRAQQREAEERARRDTLYAKHKDSPND